MYSKAYNIASRSLSYLRKNRNPYLKGFLKPMNHTVKAKVQTEHTPNSEIIDGKGNLTTQGISLPLFKPIVWIDCEMTGLDHINDHIIEICCIITDGKLNIVDECGYENVIHYSQDVLDKMDDWCVQHHGDSGLSKKVLESTNTREQVERDLLAYIKKWIPEPRKGVLAGNSVHMDRLFMLREFPSVTDHLFYRIIDVSTIMEVSHRHNPQLAKVLPKKKNAHTARADIIESINQLKFYQQHYLKNDLETQDFVNKRRLEILAEQSSNQIRTPHTTSQGTKRACESQDEQQSVETIEKKSKH